MGYEVQLDIFQGPLELLYQLVKRDKIAITEISLAEITEQYLKYMDKLKDFNLEMASEFMVIATELIEIKARILLPQDKNDKKEEESKQVNLVQRLQEYDFFKKLSLILRQYEEKASKFFLHPSEVEPVVESNSEVELKKIDLRELRAAFNKVLTMVNPEEKTEDYLSKDWEKINPESIKIQDKIEEIMTRLKNSPTEISFKNLIKIKNNRLEIIVTFLSILELTRMHKVRIRQDRLFSEINIIEKMG